MKILTSLLALASFGSLYAAADFNVRDFGAKGDGRSDDTAAVRKAADAAIKAQKNVYDNRSLYFPPGTYRLDGQITNGRGHHPEG